MRLSRWTYWKLQSHSDPDAEQYLSLWAHISDAVQTSCNTTERSTRWISFWFCRSHVPQSQLPGSGPGRLLLLQHHKPCQLPPITTQKGIGVLLKECFCSIPAVISFLETNREPQPTIKRCRPVSAPGLAVAAKIRLLDWEKLGQNDKDINIAGNLLKIFEEFWMILWGTLLCHNVLWQTSYIGSADEHPLTR